jgi:multidrug efflux system membrane fusion protein
MPSAALQAGQQGQYVFVIKPDFTVESRPVVIARSSGEIAVVAQGVKPGEKVVTDGQLNLISGSRVEVKGEPAQNAGNSATQMTTTSQ